MSQKGQVYTDGSAHILQVIEGMSYINMMEAAIDGTDPVGAKQIWANTAGAKGFTIIPTGDITEPIAIVVAWSTIADDSTTLINLLNVGTAEVNIPTGIDMTNIIIIPATVVSGGAGGSSPIIKTIFAPKDERIKTIAAQSSGAATIDYALETIR